MCSGAGGMAAIGEGKKKSQRDSVNWGSVSERVVRPITEYPLARNASKKTENILQNKTQ